MKEIKKLNKKFYTHYEYLILDIIIFSFIFAISLDYYYF